MESVTKRTKIIFLALVCLSLVLDQLIVTALLPVLPHILRSNKWSQSTISETIFSIADNSSENFQNVTSETSPILLGILFGIKGCSQLLCNPLAGVLIDYTFPLLSITIGVLANGCSQLIVAYTNDFTLLCCSRFLQGLAGAASLTGCFAGIADVFKKIEDRRKATALANISTFLGGAIGPFYGGFVYQCYGRLATFLWPFVIIGVCILLIVLLRPLCRLRYKTSEKSPREAADDQTYSFINSGEDAIPKVNVIVVKPTPIYKLAFDPYIMIGTIGLFIANLSQNAWFPTLPQWMATTFGSSDWEQGIIWTPSILFYISGTVTCALVNHYHKRYSLVVTGIALVIAAISTITIPFVIHWTLCSASIGMTLFANSIIELTLMPMLTIIVDKRYSEIYGSVSSFPPTAFSLATMFGAFVAGVLTEKLSFLYMNLIIGSVYVSYLPCLLFLRKFT